MGEYGAPEDPGTFWWPLALALGWMLLSQGCLSFAQEECWGILYSADIWANLQEHECKRGQRLGETCGAVG